MVLEGSVIKIPEPPYIVAGAMGGPLVIYLVTPLRNALTLGALDSTATALSLYKQVFFSGGGPSQIFAGGAPMARAAVPGFLVLGPAFHMYKAAVGGNAAAAVTLTALSESLIFYGAETVNAQLAFRTSKSGGAGAAATTATTTTPVSPWRNAILPYGFGLHVTRNILAMSGLRVFSTPCQSLLVSAGIGNQGDARTVVLGDLLANLVVSAASAPLHQLYGWTVTVRQAQMAAAAVATGKSETTSAIPPFTTAAREFLKRQYLNQAGTALSKVAGRDVLLRCIYNATIFTLYGAIERTLVQAWPRQYYHWPTTGSTTAS